MIQTRRREAAEAGRRLGSEYVTWDFPDGSLFPTLELRSQIIREIRRFEPHLVLTHRTCDYHPDHRAVGQAVQDASYLVTVPKIVPDQKALSKDPVVAWMPDTFTRPTPLRADIVIDGTARLSAIAQMLACHASQVFDWLPYNRPDLGEVPSGDAEREAWLERWIREVGAERVRHFWKECWGPAPDYIEAFEISEYATKLSPEDRQRLFPGCLC